MYLSHDTAHDDGAALGHRVIYTTLLLQIHLFPWPSTVPPLAYEDAPEAFVMKCSAVLS